MGDNTISAWDAVRACLDSRDAAHRAHVAELQRERDAAKARLALIASQLQEPMATAALRPAKCLMCNEPYGNENGNGLTIEAQCGCHGVGSSCCFPSRSISDWCDKPCRIDPDKNACFACHQYPGK